MVSGARVASASVARIGQSATQMAQTATRQVQRVGTAGTRAGQQFGRGMATGAQQGAAQFARVIDQAARQAQSRLSAIRPAPIRMPAVQQPPTTGGAQTPASFFAGHRQRTQPAALGPVAPGAFFESHRRRTGQAAPMRPEAFRPTPVAPAPATGGGRRESPAPRRQPDQWGGDGIGRLWALSALGGQLRSGVQRARQAADENVGVASERQTARAEARTVIEGDADRALVRQTAREAALGRGQMVVPITESDFTNAVFRGVASGLTTQRAVNLVPAGANLALAGQTTPEVASIGLTDTSNVFRDRSFAGIADIYARAQDIGTFPRGIQELFTATTKAASTAKAAGLSFEETVATVTTLSSLGPTFRGATGGQKALMAIRELDLGGLQKLGISAVRDEQGGLDFPATLRMLAAADLSGPQVVEAVGKRAAPALIALIDSVDKYRATLGELDNSAGTARSNAEEHKKTWKSLNQELGAAMDVLKATMGEGSISVRKADIALAKFFARTLAGAPALAKGAGAALEIGSRVGQLGGGVLDTMIGVHAFKQLAGGTLNPLNLFRSGETIDKRRQQRIDRRSQRTMTRGVTGATRQWRGLFGTMNRGVGTSRRGFTGLFRSVLRGGFRIGGMIAAEMAAAVAARAVGGAVSGGAGAVAGAAGGAGRVAALGTGLTAFAKAVPMFAAAVAATALIIPRFEDASEAIRRDKAERDKARTAAGLEPETAVGYAVKSTFRDLGANPLGFLTAPVGGAVGGEREGPIARFKRHREAGLGPAQALISTFIGGMFGAGDQAGAATDQVLQPVADRLPESDAKVGPLSNLTVRGMAIPMTLAEGVTLGAPVLAGAVAEMFAAAGLPEPVTLAAPDTLAPDPVTLNPIGPPDMLAPDPLIPPDLLAPRPIAMPDPLAPATVDAPALIPPDPLVPPATVLTATLAAPDPIAAPATIPPAAVAAMDTVAPAPVMAPATIAPAAVAAPDTSAPDSVTVPPLVPPVAIAAPPLLAPPATVAAAPLIEPKPVTAPATVPPGPATSPPLVPPDQLVAPPPLAPESFTAPAMLAPLPATAPPTLAPPPVAVTLVPPAAIAAPATLAPDPLAPDPIAAPATIPPAAVTAPSLLAPPATVAVATLVEPEPATAPPTLAPPPSTVTLAPLDAATVPPLVPPAAVAAPPLLAPPATVAVATLIEPEPMLAPLPATAPPTLAPSPVAVTLVPPAAIAAPATLAPDLLAPDPIAAPATIPPAAVAAPPLLAPPATVAVATLIEPEPATAPPTVAPQPAAVTLAPLDAATVPPLVPPAAVAAPATLAPDPIAAPSLLAPDPLAPDPLAPPAIEPPAAIAAPALLAPDQLATPPMLLPEPIAAPSLLAPDPLTADPPLFGPPVLTETPAIPYAPAPLPAPQDETGGVVPPGAPADVLGALAGVFDPDLVVALASLLKVTREQTAVNLRVLEEMRRKRRTGDGRGQQYSEHRPADAIDYDTAGEILEGVL